MLNNAIKKIMVRVLVFLPGSFKDMKFNDHGILGEILDFDSI